MTESSKTLGAKLKELRVSHKHELNGVLIIGLTQSDFGKIFKLNKQMVSYYETDKREPSLDLIVEFAKFFNVTTDYLLKDLEVQNHDTKSLLKELPFSEHTIKTLLQMPKVTDGLFETIVNCGSFTMLMALLKHYYNEPDERIKAFKNIAYTEEHLKLTKQLTLNDIKKEMFKKYFDNNIKELQEDLDNAKDESKVSE